MTFVVSSGQIAGLDRPTSSAMSNVRLAADYTATYEAIWRAQPEVRTVIGFLARNIAQIGLHFFERVSDEDRQRLTDHPLAQLFRKPNPKTTRYRLIESLVSDLGIWDNAIWLKMKADDGSVGALLRLPPGRVTPIGDSWMWPDKYRFKGANGFRDFDADQIVHFRGYNPEDARWGVSPMETLRGILAEAYQSSRWREQMWRSGARLSGWIGRGDSNWSDQARARFKSDWQGLYTGDGPGAGGTPVLEDGMTFHADSITPKDAEYVAARKLTREEVAAAFYIPPPMVGILDHATFSNITEQHKNLYQDTLGPWLQMISEDLALQLISPDFDSSGKIYAEFNMAEKMKGSFEEQATSLQTAVGGPWLTRNEARARQNLRAIAGGDELIVPLNVIEGGQASPTDSAPKARLAIRRKDRSSRVKAKPTEDHEQRVAEVLGKFFRRQRKAVLSALGSKDGEDWFDDDRWNDELADDLMPVAVTVTTAVASKVLVDLDIDPGEYDVDRTEKFLGAVAKGRAQMINEVTRRELRKALDDGREPGEIFDIAETSRAGQAGRTLATALAGFAGSEALKQTRPKATKTWTVNADPSRHTDMSGETVGVGELFSNGAKYPGDWNLGIDEVAGCLCTLEMEV